MNFLNNIGIKNKHLIILLFVILGLVLTTAVSIFESEKIMKLNNVLLLEEKLKTSVLTLRKTENDFLARKQQHYADNFVSSIDQTQSEITDLAAAMKHQGLKTAHTERLSKLVGSYADTFKKLSVLQIEIGLDAKSGLYGALRSSVHEVEKLAKEEKDFEILFYVLQLRRHEKDFMLRRDEQYLAKFGFIFIVCATNKSAEQMLAILKKEINSFFASPIGYLVIGIFLILNGLFLWLFKGEFKT
mgnify:CR=1 FL=1